MKHMRLFPDAATRDSVLADINYGVISSTEGVGIKLKPGIDVPPGPDPTIPFYIENPTSSSVTTNITGVGSGAPTLTIEKSADSTTWTTLGDTSTDLSIEVPANSKVYLRCNTGSWSTSRYNGNKINVGASCNVGGNIMSLLYGINFTGNETSFPSGSTFTFNNLFNDSNVVNAKDLLLPATTLVIYCYSSMFSGCTGLTTAPALPATTLANSCYFNMFGSCTGLTTAPELPATTLDGYCYYNMFYNCTGLTTAPELPATTLTQYCYQQMFRGCTSLTTAPALPATTLVSNCYQGMFQECTGLTTASALPATTLAEGCYYQMFYHCTSLNDVTVYANDISAYNCLNNWLSDVASTGTFHNLGSASYTSGASGIPSGWTEVHS